MRYINVGGLERKRTLKKPYINGQRVSHRQLRPLCKVD